MILIVSCAEDRHVPFVEHELVRLGAPWTRFNTEDYPRTVSLHVEASKGIFRALLVLEDKTLDLSTVTSVWYRRPEPPGIHAAVVDAEAREVAIAESRSTVRGLWAALHDAFWMSWPMNIRRADQKLLQLRLASDLGFDIPRTLITQSPEQAREFVTRFDAIVKTISGVCLDGSPPRAIYTNEVQHAHLSQLGQVRVCPTLFQEKITKAVELRVTVVLDKVFAAEMHTHVDPEAAVDWRRKGPLGIPHCASSLPPEVETRCVLLVRRLGLTFGAIDLIRTPDNRFVFLEINPAGQFAWIEGLTGLPIAREIAAVLAKPPSTFQNFR